MVIVLVVVIKILKILIELFTLLIINFFIRDEIFIN
jgi:hypothetical protein